MLQRNQVVRAYFRSMAAFCALRSTGTVNVDVQDNNNVQAHIKAGKELGKLREFCFDGFGSLIDQVLIAKFCDLYGFFVWLNMVFLFSLVSSDSTSSTHSPSRFGFGSDAPLFCYQSSMSAHVCTYLCVGMYLICNTYSRVFMLTTYLHFQKKFPSYVTIDIDEEMILR